MHVLACRGFESHQGNPLETLAVFPLESVESLDSRFHLKNILKISIAIGSVV